MKRRSHGALAAAAGLAMSSAASAQYGIVTNLPGTFTDIRATGVPIISGPSENDSVQFTSAVTNALVASGALFAAGNGNITDVAFFAFDNFELPTSAPPLIGTNFGLFPLWDALVVDAGSAVVHQAVVENGVNAEVIQWDRVRTFASGPGGPTGSFEVKIFDSGPALVQFIYQDPSFAGNGNGATIGVQWAPHAGSAVDFSFNTPSLSAGSVLSVVTTQPGACCLPDGTCQVIFPSACAMLAGVYHGDGSTCPAQSCPVTNQVLNGGFETGDFTGWTQFGDTSNDGVDNAIPQSGAFSAFFGAVGSQSGIQQTIAAHAGDRVQVSFWYFADPAPPNSIQVDFDGQTLLSLADDADHQNWTQFAFSVTVANDNPALQFSFQNDAGFDNLDSVSIVPAAAACYPNCDGSTTAPVLNVLDFTCFLNRFASGDSYANCDHSTTPPVLNVQDFTCFLNAFAAGCS